MKYEIGHFSDQSECDDEYKKIDSLKKLLPDWKWYDIYDKISYAEECIKEKEENNIESDTEFDAWQAQYEKENAQIDEMFEALRKF